MKIIHEKEKLLSRREVSQILEISPATLWRWSNKGILTPYYLGGRVYFKYDDILNSLIKKGGCNE